MFLVWPFANVAKIIPICSKPWLSGEPIFTLTVENLENLFGRNYYRDLKLPVIKINLINTISLSEALPRLQIIPILWKIGRQWRCQFPKYNCLKNTSNGFPLLTRSTWSSRLPKLPDKARANAWPGQHTTSSWLSLDLHITIRDSLRCINTTYQTNSTIATTQIPRQSSI